MRSMPRRPLLVFGVLAFTACASGGGTGGGAADQAPAADAVAVRVINDLVPPANITVWIEPETGARRRLGTIQPNGQQSFNYSPTVRSMDHRLVAERAGGNSDASNPFVLVGATRVSWSVSSPVVSVERGSPE